jgi:hypothetical protein
MVEKPHGKRSAWPAIGWIALLLILYPLSIGPLAWLIALTGIEWIGVFFAPLDWAANASPPIELILTWYFRFWRVPGPYPF